MEYKKKGKGIVPRWELFPFFLAYMGYISYIIIVKVKNYNFFGKNNIECQKDNLVE